MHFHELELDNRILSAVDDLGFAACTPVQAETFRYSLQGRDVYVQSQTGTGKTAAFLITIFQLFLSEKVNKPRAMVIAPTRELAVQIEQDARLLCKYLPFTIGAFYGGVGYREQENMLKDRVDLLICTPGRILDFARSRKISFSDMGIIVIDEADRLFDMGFYPDIRKMFQKALPPAERMTMLFSATLSTRVRHLAWEFMNDPREVAITPENVTVEEITQELYHVGTREKMNLLLGILRKEKPQSTLVFTNTKHMAVELSKRLKANGFTNQYLMGDLNQSKRLSVITAMKSGKLDILVATDVAARGLHIQDLDLVVNYDLPEDCENYVHRIGRTARAGKTGKAVSLACEKYVYNLPAIESFIGMKIPVLWADAEVYAEDSSAQLNLGAERYAKRNDAKRRRDTIPPPRVKRQPQPEVVKPKPRTENPVVRPVVGKPAGKPAGKPEGTPGRDMSVDERLEYYRKKYGEDFQLNREGKSSIKKPEREPQKEEKAEQKTDRKRSRGLIAALFKKKK